MHKTHVLQILTCCIYSFDLILDVPSFDEVSKIKFSMIWFIVVLWKIWQNVLNTINTIAFVLVNRNRNLTITTKLENMKT